MYVHFPDGMNADDLPEPMRSIVLEQRQQQVQQQMTADDHGHAMMRLFGELSKDQFDTVFNIISDVGYNDEPKRRASYLAGVMTGIRQSRFGLCPACNKDHDAELATELAKEFAEVDATLPEPPAEPPDEPTDEIS